MAYQVDKFNGTFLTSVEDGTIDTSTDLRFVGKNYAGYGEVQNENFLHLLENFANTTAPPKAVLGQIWFDSASLRLKFYDGTKWKTANGAEVASVAPSGLAVGEIWWDTSAKQLYAWSGGEFVLVGPEASPDLGASGAIAQVVKDTGNTNHSILKINSGGKTVSIVSQTEFTLNSSINPIDDFTLIKKGITMAKADANGITTDDYVYWGTSSNALKLGGVAATEYLQKGSITFNQEINFQDAGYRVGDQSDFRLRVENDDEIVLESVLGNPVKFIINDSGTTRKNVMTLASTGLLPGITSSYTLGSASLKWSAVHADTFTGAFTGPLTGNVNGNTQGSLLATDSTIMVNGITKTIGYTGASLYGTLFGSVQGNLTGTASDASALNGITPSIPVPASGNSIAVRDATGTIYATTFNGTASKADRIKIDDTATDSDPNYKTAKTTATANSIAARNSSGDLIANLFQGTATAARYADLAEKYLTDNEYEAGTVVSVGGEEEVTQCKDGDRALGVISAQPAYMMNAWLEGGQYIALKGRVPVKVNGAVAKGNKLVAAADGYAKVAQALDPDVFAIALESNSNSGTKVIEAVVL